MPEPRTTPPPSPASLTASPAQIQDLIRQHAEKAGIPPALALAVAEQESAFNPSAVNLSSGARGVFQFIPATAKARGIDPTDTLQNIQGGVAYLRELLDQHQGDLQKTLATYGGVKTDTTYVPGVLARVQKYQQAGPVSPRRGRLTPPTSPEDVAGALLKPKLPGLPGVGSRSPGAPPPPSTFERTGAQTAVEVSRNLELLPMAGSMAGATAGAAMGGPSVVGVPVSAVAGSSAGAVAGEEAQRGLERLVGLPPQPRHLARTAALGAAGEVGGQWIARGVQKGFAPVAKRVTLEGREALRQLRGKVLPAQVTELRPLDIMQNVAEASLFGGGKVKAFKQAQDQIVEQLVEREVGKYGGHTAPEAAGKAFIDALKGQTDAFYAESSKLHQAVGQMTGNAPVSMQTVRDWAAEELGRRAAVPSLSGESALSILRDLAKQPAARSFDEAVVIRSQAIKKMSAAYNDPDKDVIRGILSQVVQQIDNAMEQTATDAGPQVLNAWRGANKFTREGHKKYTTDFLSDLGTKHAEDVAKTLMRNNAPSTIREARAAVPAAAWKPIQASMATQLLEKATNVETGQISGRGMLAQIKTLGASFREIFPQTNDEVKRLARVLSTVQQKQGEGTGRIYIQLAQSGAVVKGAQLVLTGALLNQRGSTSGTAAAAGVILLGPAALARIMTSPTGIRWLTTGLTAPAWTPAASRAAANLATFFLGVGEPEVPTAPLPEGRLETLKEEQATRAADTSAPPRPASLPPR